MVVKPDRNVQRLTGNIQRKLIPDFNGAEINKSSKKAMLQTTPKMYIPFLKSKRTGVIKKVHAEVASLSECSGGSEKEQSIQKKLTVNSSEAEKEKFVQYLTMTLIKDMQAINP